jgi:hypothetical protein
MKALIRTELKEDVYICAVFKKVFKLYYISVTQLFLKCNLELKFLLPILRFQRFFADYFACKDLFFSANFDDFKAACKSPFT